VATNGVNNNALRNAIHSVNLSSASCRRKSLIIPMIYGLDASPYYKSNSIEKMFLNIIRIDGEQIFE
jgi:hypothetical protein